MPGGFFPTRLSALFAFLHHLAAFTLVAALAVEFVLLSGELTVRRARQLLGADLVLGASATALLLIGLLRVFFFEKGVGYYFHSVPFIAKLSLFAIVGMLSIYPTRKLLSWRPALRGGQAPRASIAELGRMRSLVRKELAAVALLILCAALMARGIGYLG